jgi:hypothetical protein
MGTARNFRVAKFTDSSELVASGGFRRGDRPGLPPILGTLFRPINLQISFIFMLLDQRIEFACPRAKSLIFGGGRPLETVGLSDTLP